MIRGVVLDVDGTVVRGDDPIPGAPAAVDRLRESGADVLFCSNNPTKGPPAYVDRLARAGIDATEPAVLTAADSTVAYLREHHPDDALYVVGEAGLVDQLTAADLRVVDDHDAADAGVVSVDRSFTYDDLAGALWALGDGTPYVGTDPDRVIPAPDRDVPGSGALINAVRGVLDHDPDAVLGKPSATARDLVFDRLGHPPAECLVVGDRLDTDIALGETAGATTALVCTGVTDRGDVAASDHDPDYVLDSLADIDRVLAAETEADADIDTRTDTGG
ncbi:HAD-IIA family hydrolase [Halobaculum sp. CBA1158]|uniref:HAD-IIA family hydrolase n=1 Tax=Halobaculum sp. CBA1158 TaxID=2904243 RepID=UPI001F1E2828|nr:HAD-IIA family hydrolase [Halobaculum sp. CBA1158]UIO99058.1 HAD-IIA family hydrolase [Halobaculum sp. CBA1158]